MITYDRNHPFLATLTEKYCLNKPGSQKETLHLVLSIKGSGITYKVGDSVGILPCNDPEVVEKTLQAIRASGDERVVLKRTGEILPLKEALTSKCNIGKVAKNFLSFIDEKMGGSDQIEAVLRDHTRLNEYLTRFEVWDFLLEHPKAEVSPQEVVEHLLPLLPRFYSIASSQMVVGDEVHLTVGMVDYVSNGYRRFGVASQYLGRQVPFRVPCIPLYLQPANHFTLPADKSAPIIMIGPGTGIAPYRGFMQERIQSGATGRNWLFFGEQHKAYDYLYGDYWMELEKKGALRVDAAFSRDSAEKVYVQHLLEKNARDVWQWLQEGAYLYVCGDAHHMAKDVDATLQRLAIAEGGLKEEEARAYFKELRLNGRYLRDVY